MDPGRLDNAVRMVEWGGSEYDAELEPCRPRFSDTDRAKTPRAFDFKHRWHDTKLEMTYSEYGHSDIAMYVEMPQITIC